MRAEKLTAATFMLLGVASVLFSVAIIYFVSVTQAAAEAFVPPGEDLSSLNAVFAAGYIFGVIEFALGIVALFTGYKLLKTAPAVPKGRK